MTAQRSALEALFERIHSVELELQAAIHGSYGESFQRILELRPFSMLLAACEGQPESSGGAFSQELMVELTGLAYERGFRYASGFGSFPALDPLQAPRLLWLYSQLPPEERAVAAERSNELIAHKHRASISSHELIWSTSFPVGHIQSNGESYVSTFEYRAYERGHSAALVNLYGSVVLELLDPQELTEADRLLHRHSSQAKPRSLSSLAGFKADSMSAPLLLELLRLGYSSPEQLRRAAKVLGITSWNRSYFDSILAGGTALAFSVA